MIKQSGVQTGYQDMYIFLTTTNPPIFKAVFSKNRKESGFLNSHSVVLYMSTRKFRRGNTLVLVTFGGAFICNYCGVEKFKYFDFTCNTPGKCHSRDIISSMADATKNGSEIVWLVSFDKGNIPVSKLEIDGIFNLRNNVTTEERVSIFCTRGQNTTEISVKVVTYSTEGFLPFLLVESKAIPGLNSKSVVTGRTPRYKFITADGIQRIKANIMYAAPYETAIWICILLLLLVTISMVSVAIRWSEEIPLRTSFSATIFWASMILIEQCHSEHPLSIKYLPVKKEAVNIPTCRFFRELRISQLTLNKSVSAQESNGYESRFFNAWKKRNIKVLNTFGAITQNSVFVCENYFQQILIPSLLLPSTALVVDESNHDACMEKLFQLSGRTDWSSNKHEPDDFLTASTNWFVTDWDNPIYHNVPKRISALMTSGIFWLWERWENAGFYRAKIKPKDDSHAEPLSLEKNDIRLVILFWLMVSAACVVIFTMELCWSCWQCTGALRDAGVKSLGPDTTPGKPIPKILLSNNVLLHNASTVQTE
ncbi:unnamed protein product [Allacma fusca]|uniref:Uncharacterized protein n=1 Tax=Allacma fusca TaxID=39272 RepID=A0A8J2P295_9HEXA|nr:unnamed protein product [Allacma fusca]